MNKAALISLLLLITSTSDAKDTEHWECALNLQQGDTGSMTLKRSDTSVSGRININRNDSEFIQELEGRWLNRELELTRFLNSSDNQVMHGIAIRVGTEQVRIGGRYAEGFNGVWNADCDLVSSGKGGDSSQQESSTVPPSISARATPSSPTSRDTVQFSAKAFHPDGIESITFFVNGKSVHRCEKDQCSTKHRPFKAGKHNWYAIAKSKGGSENTIRTNDLVVSGVGSCTISGIATGSSVAQSSNVEINLTSVRHGKSFLKSTRFDAGVYSFDGLSTGRYLLSINAPESLGIIVTPATKQISCGAEKKLRQNFEFQ